MKRGVATRGSVSVLAAGIAGLAVVLSLLTVDLLRGLEGRARAQTAADAAALAAAQELVFPSMSRPEEAASEYARRNGAALVSCRCEPGTWEAVVEVTVPVRFVFVGSRRTVSARARAVVEGGGLRSGGPEGSIP